MSTQERERETMEEPSEPTSHRTLYIIIAVVFVALAVFATSVRKERQQDAESAQLAQTYVAAVETAGFDNVPDVEGVERLFGTDGGMLCELTGSGTGEALLHQMVASGAAGPGLRSVPTGDELEEMLQRGQLAIAVYCPDKAQDYLTFMESLDVTPVLAI